MATPSLSVTEREPAAILGTITAGVAAVITLAVAFGLDLTDEQTAAILGVVAVVAPLVAAFLTRPRVTPNAKVVDYLDTKAEPDTVVAGRASPYVNGLVVNAGQPDPPAQPGI